MTLLLYIKRIKIGKTQNRKNKCDIQAFPHLKTYLISVLVDTETVLKHTVPPCTICSLLLLTNSLIKHKRLCHRHWKFSVKFSKQFHSFNPHHVRCICKWCSKTNLYKVISLPSKILFHVFSILVIPDIPLHSKFDS